MEKLLPKQNNAVFYLKDKITEELVYGGAAGGGKSALGCLWLIENCQRFPGSRWLMGRSKLKALRETTLNSFFEISALTNIQNQFKYNAQDHVIKFFNGSEILLKDLFLYPSDPNFDSLGSLEITGAFVDECNQIAHKAWQVVKSRIRYKLNEFQLTPKILGTCNPAKNWVYTEFYKKNKENNIEEYKRFIQALPTDNPHLHPSYLQALLRLDKNSRERLYYGNWEYDDDPNALISYESITNLFTNNHSEKTGKKYITADVARLGSDKAVIMVWDNYTVIDLIEFDKSRITDIQNAINALKVKHKVPNLNIVADEDGVGGGVVDNCRIKGFVNNSKALNNENFSNLKTQCFYKLADKMNNDEIFIEIELSQKQKETIIEELEYVKSYNSDSDGKMQILPKAEIKQLIGRSPDYADALAMRLYFDIKPSIKITSTQSW
ncbi:phage terminase large subunit [Paenimyroides ceti]